MDSERQQAIAVALDAASWPSELEAVDLLKWDDIVVFGEQMTVPVIKVRTPYPIDDDQSDWCKEQIEAVIGDDFSIMWLFTHPTPS